MSIRVLEDHVVNQIAAGEVVERPASVVKELLENALDAGATDIEVGLKNGGMSGIRIVDNGRGMTRQDALMCLERHATSKIVLAKDLVDIATLGFRGEALPSIASVSRFEVLTRPHEEDVGTRVRVEGGKLLDWSDAGCAAGTEITVRSLFYNVPARRKFLRTKPTELGHCVDMVTRQALARPDVGFAVHHEGRDVFRVPADNSVADRAATLLGEHGRTLVSVDYEADGVRIRGLVSPVGVTKGTASGAQYLYVNGRYVRDRVLRRGVYEAYRDLVPKGRYPVVVLEVLVEPSLVDVNVHPTKIEVRFRNPRDTTRILAEGVRQGLQHHGIRRPVERTGPAPQPAEAPPGLDLPLPPPPAPDPGDPRFVADRPPIPSYAPPPPPPRQPSLGAPPPGPSALDTQDAADRLLPVPRFRDLKVIGQYLDTYILCEGAGEMVIIDQHAAHERVMLNRFQKDREAHLGATQRLLTPLFVELPRAAAEAFAAHAEVLEEVHLEVQAMAGGVAVTGVPVALEKADLPALIHEVADELLAGGRGRASEDLVGHFLATMACHNAIRAHDPLTDYEMRALLASLDDVDFEVCAHGRPIAIRISSHELEHRFHRS